jgi:TnpA family transposase
VGDRGAPKRPVRSRDPSPDRTGLHAIVVPGTLRDPLMILDGLLELQPPGYGGPTMIITDQASYSDQIFGLFWLLGYQFSPRPAGLPDQRFWRLDPHADYGPLDRLARHRISAELIIEQWEDILRDAGSLSSGTVRASELLRALQGGGNPSRLGRAIAEVGRVAKTLHLLSWIDSEEHRRQTSIGLTRHEGRHSVARIILHGNQGQLRQPYRDGQEDRLGALGFALNALVRWNAQYLDDAITHLRPPATTLPTRTSNALTAAARAHQDARQLPLHVAPRNRSRSTPAATRTRRSGLAYVPVPLLPAGRSCRCPSPLL